MAPVPKRRLFRFGLRTMFVVVTLFSLWLGWQTKIVRDRREALADQRWDFYCCADAPSSFKPLPTIPFLRRLMGDEAVFYIHVNARDDDRQFVMLAKLFPEALVTGPVTPGVDDPNEYLRGRPLEVYQWTNR